MSQNSHERQPAWEMLTPVEKASSNRHLAEGALAHVCFGSGTDILTAATTSK